MFCMQKIELNQEINKTFLYYIILYKLKGYKMKLGFLKRLTVSELQELETVLRTVFDKIVKDYNETN